jgi:S-formylglutathione hydrolase FrmB
VRFSPLKFPLCESVPEALVAIPIFRMETQFSGSLFMSFLRVVTGLLVFTLSQVSVAETKAQCSTYPSKILGRKVKFCFQRSRNDSSIQNEPVVYFLHGLGGNESIWTKGGYSEALNKLVAEDADFPAMTFVSFETQIDSFFSDFQGGSSGSKAYETWLLKDFIPYIETKFSVCRERSCRGIAGVSMGGFGSLKIALKNPETFSVVAANSPALPPFSIHEDNEMWRNYFSQTPIGVIKGMVLLKDVRRIFPTEQLYEANNPANVVSNLPNSTPLPGIYFDVGSEDNFGFEVGYEIFKNTLETNDIPFSSFVEEGGDHFIFHHRNQYLLTFLKNWAANYR